MKKYKVENAVMNREQILGEEPFDFETDNFLDDYVEAENENEAIEFAIDALVENIINNGYDVDVVDNEIRVIDKIEEEEVQRFVNFTAEVIAE